MAFDRNLAVLGNPREKSFLALQAPEQGGGAAVDKAQRQRFVQCIGKLVLQSARALTPAFGVLEPVRPAGGVGPGAHVREARLQRVEIAFGAIESFEFSGNPFIWHAPFRREDVTRDAPGEADMLLGTGLAKIRQLACFPKAAHALGSAHYWDQFAVLSQALQHHFVVGAAHARETGAVGRRLQRLQQRRDGVEAEFAVAPLNSFDRLEFMALDPLDQIFVEWRTFAGFAERPVAGEASSAPGDLGDFVGAQIAPMAPVELAARSEGDMIDIHVQPHADGVGGDQEVHLSVLIERHLRVAGARGKRAHHHRRAAAMTAQQLGDGVNFLG